MSRVLSGFEPNKVFEFFEDICAIPHGSGNTKAISDYCVKFAKERNLTVYQDSLNNVIIKKPASEGYEKAEPVVLQGHLDMVCEKDSNVEFDFFTDSIQLKVDGDFISANGTTLGGDDGVAVAIALAILDDDSINHPPLEVVFTTDEETGMYGAAGLDTSLISAKRFINIDSEDEGVFTVGCAGGARVDIKLPINIEYADMAAYEVTVSGLIGGHSGTEINKGRLNANKILGEFLSGLSDNVLISKISGGSKDNAIPVSAHCVVAFSGNIAEKAKNFEKQNRIATDNNLTVSVSKCISNIFCDLESSRKIIKLLCDLPYGVQSFSKDIDGLVETSLNLGIVKSDEKEFSASLSVRSSKSLEKAELINKLTAIGESYGANVSVRGDYPAWEYRSNSPLREKMVSVFKEIYGKEPRIEIIHAGLECGLFGEKIKNIDAVSIGPDLFDIHTPRERLSISSLVRTYKYICSVLEALK